MNQPTPPTDPHRPEPWYWEAGSEHCPHGPEPAPGARQDGAQQQEADRD